MKRFIVFAWVECEAGGGWNDIIGSDGENTRANDPASSWDSLEEARRCLKQFTSWYPDIVVYHHQIVDLRTGEVVERG